MKLRRLTGLIVVLVVVSMAANHVEAAAYHDVFIASHLYSFSSPHAGDFVDFQVLWELYSDFAGINYSHFYRFDNRDLADPGTLSLQSAQINHTAPITDSGWWSGDLAITFASMPVNIAFTGGANFLGDAVGGEISSVYISTLSPFYYAFGVDYEGPGTPTFSGAMNAPLAVPEPGTFALFGVVGGIAALFRRRFGRKKETETA